MSEPRLLDRMQTLLRTRHYSIRTEQACLQWAKRFILFHGRRHPSSMGSAEINEFLSHLAVERTVSASTQRQALSAIVFLYRDVLGDELPCVRSPLDSIMLDEELVRPSSGPSELTAGTEESSSSSGEAFEFSLAVSPLVRQDRRELDLV